MAEFEVQADNLHKTYAKIKELGDGGLRREVTRAIRDATKPAKDAVKASAIERLPHRGGLNVLVGKSRISNQVRTGARTAGVRLRAANPYQIGALDRGRLRHPVFGNRRAWVNQPVRPGWWTEPLEAQKPAVAEGIQNALQDVARKLNT